MPDHGAPPGGAPLLAPAPPLPAPLLPAPLVAPAPPPRAGEDDSQPGQIRTILEEHPGGINGAQFPQQFRAKFRCKLDFVAAGFGKLVHMMDALDFVDVDRSQQGPQKKGAVYFRLARGEQGRQGSGAGRDPTKNLHVSGYASGTTPDAIRALIAPFVAVHEIVVKPRYMFVNTASVEGASDARSALNGTAFPLGPLLIGFAKLQ